MVLTAVTAQPSLRQPQSASGKTMFKSNACGVAKWCGTRASTAGNSSVYATFVLRKGLLTRLGVLPSRSEAAVLTEIGRPLSVAP